MRSAKSGGRRGNFIGLGAGVEGGILRATLRGLAFTLRYSSIFLYVLVMLVLASSNTNTRLTSSLTHSLAHGGSWF